uniref:CABIT domain-containing protein n=1 Tax=Strigamia maritima TaxID=126957 RepID=T1JGG7_STRMM
MHARMLTAATWDEASHSLSDFSAAFPLPQFARIVQGHYLSVGLPRPSFEHLIPSVFLLPGNRTVKVAGQCVKFKDSKAKPFGVKLSIPETYSGLFEILSEDGRSAKVIESVAELVRRFPDSCIVRESVKVWTGKGDGVELITARWKVVQRGCRLVLVGQVSLDGSHETTTQATTTNNSPKNRFLRCFESNGESVYFRLDQKAKFSPVARDDGLAGLHTVGQLVKKRFPIMVRLVEGAKPTSYKNFVPEIRLYATSEEDFVLALPLSTTNETKHPKSLVAIPLTADIKVQGVNNSEHLARMPEYGRILQKCRKLIRHENENIHVFDVASSKQKTWAKRFMLPIRRTLSDPSDKEKPTTTPNKETKTPTDNKSYDEIDQLYDYVRGFVPIPPVPPPIESIPVRRHSVPCPPTKHELSRRYLPSPAQMRQRQRFVRQKSKSNKKANSPCRSPLFRMRYKSLTDLTADADSSNSAGSAGSNSDRVLFRPRSLTSLLFSAKSEKSSKCLGTLYL